MSKMRNRRSIRLPEYDYSQPGAYFVTVCTQERGPLFGEVVDGAMRLNEAGRTAQACWEEIPTHFRGITVDAFVVMPNHIHGIVIITDRRGTACRAPTGMERFGEPVAGSLPTIMRSFKSAVTKRVNELRGTPGVRLWQRNFYERVIRGEEELKRARQYILDNPLRWHLDPENPTRPSPARRR